MLNKGFKYRQVVFKGLGSGENYNVYYNWGTRDDRTINRAKSVIASIARALGDMGIGWNLDASYNEEWISDPDHEGCVVPSSYGDVPVKSSTEMMPSLCLKNSVSGNKLFLCYLCNSSIYGVDIPNSQMCTMGPSVANPSFTGLCISMIPGDSDQIFGDPRNNTLIPSTATRLYGMCEANNKTTASQISYARFNGSGYTYYWGILATPYCISVVAGWSNTEDPPVLKFCFACGRVFDSLAHTETLPQAKYGLIQFTQPSTGNNMEAGTVKTSTCDFGDTSEPCVCTFSFRRPYNEGSTYTAGNVFKVNGDSIGFTSTSNIRLYPDNYLQLSHYVKDPDSNLRWVPYIVGVVSSNLQEDGIIPGDGVKGLLDHNLFRCARIERGHLLCNGRFYSLDNNLVIGWDPSNSVML